jgi:hypothetical protein
MARNPASQPRLQTKTNGVPKSTRHARMHKVIKAGAPEGPVRIRLDRRTIITCKPQAVAFWRERYPNLEILP